MPVKWNQSAHAVDRALAYFVFRDFGDVSGVDPVVGKRYGDVALTARVGSAEAFGLADPLVAFRVETHHEFSKTYCTHKEPPLHKSI